jgi:DegV family protein with EDD domain
MAVKVITDSTADLSPAQAAHLGVVVVPLTIEIAGRSYRDSIDVQPAEFYRMLPATGPLPRSSAPSPGAFLEAFDQALKDGDGVVCITISSRLSGSLNAASAARERARDPNRVTVLDSLAATAAEANIVTAAALAAADGGGQDDVVAAAVDVRGRQRLLIGLETLDYLHRGGRIGRARTFLGGLLNIKPLLTLQDGEVAPAERVRSRARMLARLHEFALSYADPEMVTIIHSACQADADALENQVRTAFPGARIASGWIGPVVGLYTGPGAIGVALVPKDSA